MALTVSFLPLLVALPGRMLHEGRLFLVGMSWRREVLNDRKHFGSSNGFLVDDRLLEAEHHAGADKESKGGLPPITMETRANACFPQSSKRKWFA